MAPKKTLFILNYLLSALFLTNFINIEFEQFTVEESDLLKCDQVAYQGLSFDPYVKNISGNIVCGVYFMSGSDVIVVRNAAELEQAFANATGGEVIELAPGDYGSARLRFKSFPENVTIRGAESGEAVFENLVIVDVDNVSFVNIFTEAGVPVGSASFPAAVRVSDSSNISFTDSEFRGTLDGIHDNNASGVFFTNSQNVSVTNSYFLEVNGGISATFSQNLNFSNNRFDGIRQDGFILGAVDDVVIENNDFGQFVTDTTNTRIHAGIIQFFTANVDQGSSNIVIRGNTSLQGLEDNFPIGGIFIRDEAGGNRFSNVLIEDNLIYTRDADSITVNNGDDVVIRNNTVINSPTSDVTTGINIADGTLDALVENNVVNSIITRGSGAFTGSNNVIVQTDDPSSPTFINNLFFDAFSGEGAVLEDFTPRPDGLLLSGGQVIGARTFDSAPDSLTARVTSELFHGTSDALDAEFSAEFTANDNGLLDEDDATYVYDFGDGTTAEGFNVRHTYAEPGTYVVTLTVTRGGESDTTTNTVIVESPEILEYQDVLAVNSGQTAVSRVSSGNDILEFDTTNPLNIGRPDSLFGLDDLYLGLDVRPDSAAGGHQLLFNNHGRYGISLTNDRLVFFLVTDDGELHEIEIDNADIFDGEFHNVAISLDGSLNTFSAFINGENVGTISGITGKIDESPVLDVLVGGTVFGNRGFSGEIKNIEAFSAPEPVETGKASTEILSGPSAGTVVPQTPEPQEPVGNPTEPDGPGATAPEEPEEEPSTSAPNTSPGGDSEPEEPTEATYSLATEVGANAEISGDVTQNGNEFSFEGDGYINLGRPDEFTASDEVAISFDVRTDGETDSPQRVFWDTGRYGVEIKGDTVNFRLFTDEGEFISISVENSGVTDGNYHSLAFTFDSSSGEFAAFINGAEIGRETGIIGDLRDPSNNKDITVGGTSGGKGFEGDIKDFKLFDTVETAETELGINDVVTAVAAIRSVDNSPATSDTGTVPVSNVVPLNTQQTSNSNNNAMDDEADWAMAAISE